MIKQAIHSKVAPQPSGTYSQAIQVGNTVYLAGQIPLNINADFAQQVKEVFENLRQVAVAAGGDLDNIVRLCVYLTDLTQFSVINDTMKMLFAVPYPARTTIQVAALPKGAQVEIDAIMVVPENLGSCDDTHPCCQ